MARSSLLRRYSLFSICAVTLLGISAFLVPSAAAYPIQPSFNHFLYTNHDDFLYDDNAQPGTEGAALAQQAYDDRAYPHQFIDATQANNAYNANQALASHPIPVGDSASRNGRSWQLAGPLDPEAVSQATYTGRPTAVSGRVTAIVVANDCNATVCRVWLGAAGGGVWRTDNGLAARPTWKSVNNGIRSNAIGSLALDPNDHSGRTIYVGTGEENGSSDSEAGVGLYKSTDFGDHWHLVEGSFPAAKDRSIGSVAIDPTNAKHIYIGTDVARHGSSASNGGRFSPPGAPVIGLYESKDGGRTFSLVFSKESDVVNPGSPNGSDFFRGGVSKIQFSSTGLPAGVGPQVYFSMFDYGVFRSANGSFEQIFASAGGGSVANSATSRTEFSLAPMGQKLRIYVGDTGASPADFYRVDDANVAAATLTDGTNNPGWIKLSNPTPGTPGFSSYDYCSGL
ncbi:WD40/YVTN/BNR-like repeat-containing protein [Dictyobacter kobayashii]|nr:hypothetical protein [Dictyobacter kobayashii]